MGVKAEALIGAFATGLFALLPTSAFSDPCYSLSRLSPSELQDCVRDLRENQRILEMENETSQKQICLLARIMADSKPVSGERNADLDGFIKGLCPIPKKKK
jgi:hypothetical protein